MGCSPGSVLGISHQQRPGKIFVGVRDMWYVGGVRVFFGLVRVVVVSVCRASWAGILTYCHGSWGGAGIFDMILSVVVVVSRVPRNEDETSTRSQVAGLPSLLVCTMTLSPVFLLLSLL
jgi:hypothetical protein